MTELPNTNFTNSLSCCVYLKMMMTLVIVCLEMLMTLMMFCLKMKHRDTGEVMVVKQLLEFDREAQESFLKEVGCREHNNSC